MAETFTEQQWGPGKPASATSQPWGVYYEGSESQQTSPYSSQPLAPTLPQEAEHFNKEEA